MTRNARLSPGAPPAQSAGQGVGDAVLGSTQITRY